jgi:hypothetical protein
MRVEHLLERRPQLDAFVATHPAVVLASHAASLDECRPVAGSTVQVELIRGEPPPELDEHWRELLSRADTPNVFMEPRVLRAAAPFRELVTLLAWEPCGVGRRLIGFWGFSIGKPHLSVLPIAALCGPATDHAYLSAPVIERDRLEAVLHAMLDALAAAPELPKVVALESMSGEGATYEALLQVLAQRANPSARLAAKPRPILAPAANAENYLEKALSSSSRKKLRQHRRRLGEKGRLETTVARSVPDVRRAFEAFLALESEGWKGRRGTAMACCPDDPIFALNLVVALARTGDAWIFALELDGRPVSMQVVLRAGAAAYTWKTAYDETLGDFSPGVLLFEDCSKAFLGDPSVAFTDSCAFDDTGYMGAWTERKLIIDFWFDVRRGGSAKFTAVAGLQKAYLPLRETAKQAYRNSPRAQALVRLIKTIRRAKRGERSQPVAGRFAGAFRG